MATKCLERVVKRNYDQIVDGNCVDIILEYVRTHDDVEEEGVLFIRRLAKVCSHILRRSSRFNEDDLKRIYGFSLTGAEKTRKMDEEERSIFREAHFLDHAGDVAMRRFKKSGEVGLCERAYEHRIESVRLIEESDTRGQTVFIRSFAGDAAVEMFKATGGRGWRQKALDCYEGFLDHFRTNPDPRREDFILRIREKYEALLSA
jgi:hypothetical protein